MRRSPARLTVLAALSLVLAAGSAAAQKAPPAQQPQASPASPEVAPSPSAVAAAQALIVATGISRSFATLIPQFIEQIGTNLTQTRPELLKDLNGVLAELKPEFEKQAAEMVDIAARIYAKQIPEPDLAAAVAFFESPPGRKYVEAQPAILTEVVTAMQGWQSKVSTDMMTRVRAEMKKKGHEL